jgi:hypothetical protein
MDWTANTDPKGLVKCRHPNQILWLHDGGLTLLVTKSSKNFASEPEPYKNDAALQTLDIIVDTSISKINYLNIKIFGCFP